MQKSPGITINLAKGKGETLVDRVITFALTTGRIVIIATELIALGAFLYRFSLDRTLVDLHDRIQQEQAVVTLLKDNEKTFRNLQDRLALSSSLTNQGDQLPTYLTTIIDFAGPDVDIHTISVAPEAIRIEAKFQSIVGLSNFVDQLKAYKPITSVSLDRISNQTETATITVNITATLQKPKGRILPGGASQ